MRDNCVDLKAAHPRLTAIFKSDDGLPFPLNIKEPNQTLQHIRYVMMGYQIYISVIGCIHRHSHFMREDCKSLDSPARCGIKTHPPMLMALRFFWFLHG